MNKILMDRKEKTMVLAIALSIWGPVVTGIAMTMTDASTQMADFLRRTIEFLVLVTVWLMYRYLARHQVEEHHEQRIHNTARLIIALVIAFSAISTIMLAVIKTTAPVIPTGNAYLGLSIAFLGLLVNGSFWRRYRQFDRETPHPIMLAQSRLYGAKTVVDFCVIIALGSTIVFSGLWVSYWIDLSGTYVIAIYLLFSVYLASKRRIL